MLPRNLELMEKAKAFVEENLTFCTYVCLIGSVAREEADEFSDIDLICFTGREQYLGEQDISYNGEIVQLQVKSILEFPNKELFSYNPWHFRYLNESVILKDTNAELSKLQGWAQSYFSSIQGQRDVIQDVERIVQGRKEYAIDQLRGENYFAATHAAMGAWAEAALMYQFLHNDRVAIDSMIPNIMELPLFDELLDSVPIKSIEQVDISEVSQTMTRLRLYLRDVGFSHLPGLSDLQDEIGKHKEQRLLQEGELFNLLWQSYSEAFLLLLKTSQDEEFHTYYAKLPEELKERLETIGFIALPKSKVESLLNISDKLLDLSKHELASEQKS